jgi:single-stranded-DNA-specific exonuclease
LKEIDLYKINKIKENVIVLLIENINEGLIGIIASKVKEYFNKPCVVFTNLDLITKVQQDLQKILILADILSWELIME